MKIGIAYAIAPTSRKARAWHDGFTAGIDHISERHEICWWNVLDADNSPSAVRKRLAQLDVLLVKSSWQGTADRVLRPYLAKIRSLPTGILVSGSGPPRWCDIGRYDVTFYQTSWYGDTLPLGANARWAFGIDTSIMHEPPTGIKRDIDWLFVGTPVDYKRPLRLLEKEGRRVVVGDTDRLEASEIIRHLRAGGVEIHDFQTYQDLALFYQRAANVLVPCTLHGGGERAVLEGLASGCTVHVPEDNPKLLQLLSESQVRVSSHVDYGTSIESGLIDAARHPTPRRTKLLSHVACSLLARKTQFRGLIGRAKRRLLPPTPDL